MKNILLTTLVLFVSFAEASSCKYVISFSDKGCDADIANVLVLRKAREVLAQKGYQLAGYWEEGIVYNIELSYTCSQIIGNLPEIKSNLRIEQLSDNSVKNYSYTAGGVFDFRVARRATKKALKKVPYCDRK